MLFRYLFRYLFWRLASKTSFERVNPQRVIALLQVISSVNQRSPAVALRCSGSEAQSALLHIWQLSQAEYHKQGPNHFAWHRVMAACNSIYQLLTPLAEARQEFSDFQNTQDQAVGA
jgi:hypothetical protein